MSYRRQCRWGRFTGTVAFSVGWGHLGAEVPWDVTLRVDHGRLTDAVPRLRGADILQPASDAPVVYHFSSWERNGEQEVRLRTVTHGNANVVTDGTQGLNVHLDGDDSTRVVVKANGVESSHTIGELHHGSADHKEETGPRRNYTRST